MDSAHETLKAALEAIRDMALNALNQIRVSHEERSMGWKMQSMPVCKAFHEGCFIGNRWQMPSMQKHGVHTYSVRQVNTCDCRSK